MDDLPKVGSRCQGTCVDGERCGSVARPVHGRSRSIVVSPSADQLVGHVGPWSLVANDVACIP